MDVHLKNNERPQSGSALGLAINITIVHWRQVSSPAVPGIR
jgi:hypothetical protein